MVIGYYDSHGFPNLIPGDASTQTDEVNQAIASQRTEADPGHYRDYSLPEDSPEDILPDRSELPEGDEHPSDCVADFSRTSFSADNTAYSGTRDLYVGPGFVSYIAWRYQECTPAFEQYWMDDGTLTWTVLTNQIDAGRPMVFLVDTDGDGKGNHYVTVIGYREAPDPEYRCLDTWGTKKALQWHHFVPSGGGDPWGVLEGWSFTPLASIRVDCDGSEHFATIQDALDFAMHGETVVVAPGVYSGDRNRELDFAGKSVHLVSEEGHETTIIDCDGLGRGLCFDDGELRTSVVEGLTVRHGSELLGGGLYSHDSSPTIQNVRFEWNDALVGGGAYCDGGSPVLDNVVFFANDAEWGTGVGGGVYCTDCSPVVMNCTFCGNAAAVGGAMLCGPGSAPEIENCILAFSEVGEGIVCEADASPIVSCCDVYGNAGGDSLCGVDGGGNFSSDPRFCSAVMGVLDLCADSPCLPENNSCGELIGALGVGECAPPLDSCEATTDRWDGVLVTWTCSSPGVLGFRIERNGALVHSGSDPEQRSFLDVNALAGTQVYAVCTYDSCGNGPPSEAIGVQPGNNWCGNIDTDTIWTEASSPYIVLCDVRVGAQNSLRTLTIEPGVKVRFASGTGLKIGHSNWLWSYPGRLEAQGNSAEPIVFTSASGDSGDWKGIYFHDNQSHGGLLNNCIIENAGQSGFPYNAALQLESGEDVVVDSCLVRANDGYGVVVGGEDCGSDPTLSATSFVGNRDGDVLILHGAVVPAISDCAFDCGELCAVYSEGADVVLSGNEITASGPYAAYVPASSSVRSNNLTGSCRAVALSAGVVRVDHTVEHPGPGVSYLVLGDVSVGRTGSPPATLSVAPGVELRFESGFGLRIGYHNAFYSYFGRLEAVGTPSEPVLFTSSSGEPGGWKGIYFHYNQSRGGILRNCIVENAGQGGWWCGANLQLECSYNVVVDSCLIHGGSGYGIAISEYDLGIPPSVTRTTVYGTEDHAITVRGSLAISHTIATGSVSGCGIYATGEPPSVLCCDVWDNGGGDYCDYGGVLPDQTGLNGNISQDPLFCAPASGDFRLHDDSPCGAENNPECGQIGAFGCGVCGTGVVEVAVPTALALRLGRPNPSRGSVVFAYEVPPSSSSLEITVHNLRGQVVRTLHRGSTPPGYYSVTWDGRSDAGRPVASGVYFCRVSMEGKEVRTKVVLIR